MENAHTTPRAAAAVLEICDRLREPLAALFRGGHIDRAPRSTHRAFIDAPTGAAILPPLVGHPGTGTLAAALCGDDAAQVAVRVGAVRVVLVYYFARDGAPFIVLDCDGGGGGGGVAP